MKITEKRWGLRYRDTKILAGIDQYSGGYPYSAGVDAAKFWNSKEDAETYSKHFTGQFEVVQILVSHEVEET